MERVWQKSILYITIFRLLQTLQITKLGLPASEKRNEISVKGCHCKNSEKINILSRVKFSPSASWCKQVGVSRAHTRKSPRDWPSFRQQPVRQPPEVDVPPAEAQQRVRPESAYWAINRYQWAVVWKLAVKNSYMLFSACCQIAVNWL